MTTNSGIFRALLAEHRIQVQDTALLHQSPEPLPDDFDFGRVSGMMLGLAVGDALGNTSEGMTPTARAAQFGEIRDYLPHPRFLDHDGYPSDDTQLAYWALEQMIADRGFVPEHVLDRFAEREIFGIGNTVRRAVLNRRAGLPWDRCGAPEAGNGALMRAAPILIPHLREPGPDLWADAALYAMITHNDSAAIASCVAFVYLLWELLRSTAAPPPVWWVETFLRALRPVEADRCYETSAGAAMFRGTLSDYLERELLPAHLAGVPVREACDTWHSGGYLLQTLPCVLYILMRHAHDPEEAIVRAVNDTWDNDTVAAIVGAAVGALHGEVALPERWKRGLSGRTGLNDDGRVQELLATAERSFRPR